MVLWDYTIERRTLIHNKIPRPLFQNDGLTPHDIDGSYLFYITSKYW